MENVQVQAPIVTKKRRTKVKDDLKEAIQALVTYCQHHNDECLVKGNCPMCGPDEEYFLCKPWDQAPFLWDADDLTERLKKIRELVRDGEMKNE